MESTLDKSTAEIKPHSADHFGEQRDYWWNRDFLELMSKRWDIKNVKTALDVGCGIGHWGQVLSLFLSENAKIYGIDREQTWIEKAQERSTHLKNDFEYRIGLAESIPFPDNSFDMVTCQTVLIHVSDIMQVLTEMMRVLKPGGLLVVAEPNNCASQLIFDSTSYDDPLPEILRTVQFHVMCERGKANLGLGFESAGDIIPSYFQKLELEDIQVYLSDKTTPMIPPYANGEQQIWIKQAKEWLEEDIILWNKDETREYFIAGGGENQDFEELWLILKQRWKRSMKAIADNTYATAGGNVLYLISGRKAK